METIFYILAKTVQLYLSVASYAMLARVVIQFFVSVEESKLYVLLCYISEPVILPFRIVMAKLNIGQNIPIDMPFMAACIGLSILQVFLPAI